jgi:LemA protein
VVDNGERIRRMEADGVLTRAQAEMLRASLARQDRPPPNRRLWTAARGRVVFYAIAVLFVAGLLGIVLAAGGGPTEVQDVAQTLNQPGGHGEMNRLVTSFLAVGVLLVVPLLLFVYFHNSLVGKEEAVSESWAQVESNFQRRADMIPALVQSVSRYLRHERETLAATTEQRGRTAATLDQAVERLIEAQKEAAEVGRGRGQLTEDQERLTRLFAAQRAVAGRAGEVFAVVEAYPELRSSDQFLELQAQIEGTENRINVARQRFNDAVGEYNAAMRMMPWNLIAALGGFSRKAYFRSEDEARDAPALSFD